ncbi:hypothetical protein HN371_18965 [Candidatus Poribacteria bacterium]|jgi:flagellin-like hook-associated protein FlgL|nr:hypothetical protein [Candidatus Poribacteria bacterium]MBT5536505.1 hypothetical protein [Candidatus Poribacteria bacterium]MBT7098697.1 hypothetical protein [Candidatus Poribacteria bacterium]MBT7804849.1 hypothetical protein [Candidatus Poribacteria bacterium]
MRPRSRAERFDWLDCEAVQHAVDVATIQRAREDKTMFRIQSNVPATPSVNQQLTGLKFDARQAAQQAQTSPSAREQMRIVGGPTAVEQRRSEVGTVRQTNHNVASAATVSQILETGLSGTREVLQRLFQVTQRAQDEGITDGDRRQLQSEVRSLRQELDEMSNTAKFSGIPLLNGAQRALTFQLGLAPAGGEAHLALTDVRPETVVPGVDPQAVSTPESSRAAAEVVAEAIDAMQLRLDKIGGFRERLQVVADDGAQATAEESSVKATRTAEDAVAMLTRARQQILSAPTTSLLAQVSLVSQEAMALIRP